MKYVFSILIGYALGCINPAAIIAKIKKHNLREEGTGNLGATNATMVLGKGWGAFVMIYDIMKGIAAYFIAKLLFPTMPYAALFGGLGAVLGHIFPFYLRFRGGKGLATFGGVVLVYNPLLFLVLIALCLVIMLVVNYSFIFPFTGALLFWLLASLESMDIGVVILTGIMSLLIVYKHFGNLKKARNSSDIKVRDYIKRHIFGKKDETGNTESEESAK